MKSYFKFINIIDRTFLVFCIFLFCLIWTKYFIRNIFVATVVACFLCIIIVFFIMFFIGKKENRRFLNNKEQKTVLSVKNFFKFNNVKTIKEQFVAKLKVDFIQKDAFVLRDRVYYLLIDEELISEKDVIKLLRKYSDVKSFNIICSSYDNSAQDFVDNLLDIDVNLIDAKKLVIEYKFDVSEVKNQIKFKQSRRTSFKDFLKLLINKENFKGYFISGLVLFFYSLFFKQSLYYYIFGSTLFLLAFACKFISRAKYVKKF